MTQWIKIRRIILLFLLLILSGCSLSPKGEAITQADWEAGTEKQATEESSTVQETFLWVHVCGEVVNPGIYSFKPGSRVYEAIEAAGGFTDDADSNSVNLALSLSDESKIYVASKEGIQNDSESVQETSDGRININTADLDELMTLPGIGEKRAESILKLRQERGSFQKIEDLLEVEGIKEGIFEQIKDLIKV